MQVITYIFNHRKHSVSGFNAKLIKYIFFKLKRNKTERNIFQSFHFLAFSFVSKSGTLYV